LKNKVLQKCVWFYDQRTCGPLFHIFLQQHKKIIKRKKRKNSINFSYLFSFMMVVREKMTNINFDFMITFFILIKFRILKYAKTKVGILVLKICKCKVGLLCLVKISFLIILNVNYQHLHFSLKMTSFVLKDFFLISRNSVLE